EYDTRGRIVRHLESHQTVGFDYEFDYDQNQRLTEVLATGENRREKFVYDRAGNRLPQGANGDVIAAGNRLTTWGARQFAYDERGRLSMERDRRQTREFRYDSADQLSSVVADDAVVATYEYDSLRRRLAKTVNGRRTDFGWEG